MRESPAASLPGRKDAEQLSTPLKSHGRRTDTPVTRRRPSSMHRIARPDANVAYFEVTATRARSSTGSRGLRKGKHALLPQTRPSALGDSLSEGTLHQGDPKRARKRLAGSRDRRPHREWEGGERRTASMEGRVTVQRRGILVPEAVKPCVEASRSMKLLDMRVEHLRNRGNEDMKRGNYRGAVARYTEALGMVESRDMRGRLLSNRSLALCSCGEASRALQDALEAAEFLPAWDKPHYRAATAYVALKEFGKAARHYGVSHRLAPDDASRKQTELQLKQAVRKMTQEEVSREVLALSEEAMVAGQATGLTVPVRVEVATDEELVEGLTQHVMRENRRLKDVVKDKVLSGEMSEADGKAADLEYHARLSRYLLSGVSTEEALVELGHAHCGAKCFLQAREHARQAVESVLSRAEGREARGPERSGGTAEGMQGPVHSSQRATASGSREQRERQTALLGEAWALCGKACLAEAGHEDCDPREAVRCLTRATDIDPDHSEWARMLQDAGAQLSQGELQSVLDTVYGPLGMSSMPGVGPRLPANVDPAVLEHLGALSLLERQSAEEAEGVHERRGTARERKAERRGSGSDVGSEDTHRYGECASPPLGSAGEETSGGRKGRSKAEAESPSASAIGGGGVDGGSGVRASTQAEVSPAKRAALCKLCVRVAFPGASAAQLGSRPREAMREAVAAYAGVPLQQVSIEGARVTRDATDGKPVLVVSLCSLISGPDSRAVSAALTEAAGTCGVRGVLGQDASLLDEIVGILGEPCNDRSEVTWQDLSHLLQPHRIAPRAQDPTGTSGAGEREPTRPKKEIDMPHRIYRLVDAHGRTAERKQTGGVAMARVYYDIREREGNEVWVEVADRSVRWRQSASEVRVMALRVPSGLRGRDIRVELGPRSVKVSHATTGEVWLEGELHRGINRVQSTWDYGGGEGPDGLVLFLEKTNAELYVSPNDHSKSWWTRLFETHSDIPFDAQERDFSDLPPIIRREHLRKQAIEAQHKAMEQKDDAARRAFNDADAMRKRHRQERLHEMRTGEVSHWVHLERQMPSNCPLPPPKRQGMPSSQRDRFGQERRPTEA